MFDKNKITNYCGVTEINRPLKTSDILTIIHAIKNKEEDCNKAMSITVDKIIASFLKLAKINNADIPLFPYLKIRNDQCLSIQIWDIASYCVEKGKAIIGEDLSLRYELELSALLSCYNEHFSSNELWKMQSANQVHRSALSRTDVLNDHQVLLSERVCLEISQVNYPKLRPISAKRLFTYGYDSTSIFLWGYLVIVSAGNEVCEIKASQLHEEMLILFSEKGEKNDKIEQMIVQKQLISREIDQYNALEKICIEERHKDFIKGGLKIKGLHIIQEHVERIFMSIKELSDTTLAADTSKTSSEISSLLKEVRSMNDKQSESSSRLSILGLILAFSAVVPITEFIIKIVPSWGNSKSMLIILSATTSVLLFITLIIIYKKRK